MSNIVSIRGYKLSVQNGEPMVKDLDLAERLGFGRPRDIRALIKRMVDSGSLKPETVCATVSQTPNGGRPSTIYHLTEKAVLKVITKSETAKADQITDEMIDVFIEYRNGSAKHFNVPNNLPEALRLAADQAEQIEKLEHTNKALLPKAAFHDKVICAPDTITVAESAKILNTGRTRLFTFLRQVGWVTRKNEPYQDKINAGLMDVKLGNWEHPEHGIQQAVTAMITGKGLAKLQQLFSQRATA